MCNKAEQRNIEPEGFSSFVEKNFGPSVNYINGNISLKTVIFPGQDIMTLRYEHRKYIIQTMKWGLQLPGIRRPLNNKRIEDINEKKFWLSLFTKNRLLIPLTGFYEWRKSDKQQFRIFINSDDIFYAGGFFTPAADNQSLIRCTMLTREAGKFMQKIHHRMPVVFSTTGAKEFLHSDPETALDMATTFSDNLQMCIEEITPK